MTMNTLRIAWGNDFTLRVEVLRHVTGVDGAERWEPLPLERTHPLHVHLVREAQVYHMAVTASPDGVLAAKACGRRLGYGHYGLEVMGRTDGHDWRTWRGDAVWIEDEGWTGSAGPAETDTDGSVLWRLEPTAVEWRAPLCPQLWVEAETMRLRARGVADGELWVDNYGHLWSRRGQEN